MDTCTQSSPLYPCMCKYAFAGLVNFNLTSESIVFFVSTSHRLVRLQTLEPAVYK